MTIPTSQNLRFSASIPQDVEYTHPAGAALIRLLRTGLLEAGWNIGGFDNWRDSGWMIECRREASEMLITISAIDCGEWMLQISPDRTPGMVGRWLGAKASATPDNVQDLAIEVSKILLKAELLGHPRWQWDDFPDDETSTPEPKPPNKSVDATARSPLVEPTPTAPTHHL